MISGDPTFIGTTTVLVRCAGFTFLSDPNFLHQGTLLHDALGLVSPHRAISIHDDDDTVCRSPLSDLCDAAGHAELATEILFLERAETYSFSVGEPG